MAEIGDDASSGQVTQLLADWGRGNKQALDELTSLVYRELRKLAAGHLARENGAATLQPTALVNEAYLRMAAQDGAGFQNRSHFFGVAARLMRQILVDHARKGKSQKRGGGAPVASLDEALSFAPERHSSIVDLDDALEALAKVDERKVRVIEMRHFAGLSIDETASVLGVGTATVVRDQRMAEAWLFKEMRAKGKPEGV